MEFAINNSPGTKSLCPPFRTKFVMGMKPGDQIGCVTDIDLVMGFRKQNVNAIFHDNINMKIKKALKGLLK